MSQFGETAARLCGAASTLLGWRPDEFWNATPVELALALSPPGCKPVEPTTIEELRRLFPDDLKA
jgi:hypothetical protein